METLIVVAIIAILLAVAIPVFTARLHKVRVTADRANLRACYAEIRADYIFTGEYNNKVPVDWSTNSAYDWKSVTFLSGEKVYMQAGICAVSFDKESGYSIVYQCNAEHADCAFNLSVNTNAD